MSKKQLKIVETIKKHVMNNAKEYITVTLIFVIGIFLGVLFINNIQEGQRTEINSYLNNFIEKFKNMKSINNVELLKTSICKNMILAVTIWFFGTTVVGIPVVFGIVLYKGFSFGYTIAVFSSIMGITRGVIFAIAALLLQNILFIPAILAISVSGFKLYKSIVRNQQRENVKLEIIRHTIFSLLMLIVLIISSIVEIFISTNILKLIIKYF